MVLGRNWYILEVAEGVDCSKPGIYQWHIEGLGSYIGKYGRIRRATKEYGRNLSRLLSGRPYRKAKPEGFRDVHHALARAILENRAITLTILENVDPAEIDRRERELIEERGTLNGTLGKAPHRSEANRALSAVCSQFTAALARGLKRARPEVVIDEQGYVASPEENLLPGMHLAEFESDLRQGAGGELEGKFCAAHSSSALAVNCFAPFRQRKRTFDLGRHRGLRLVGFEQQFPTGLKGTPPHLDLVAEGPSGLVAVESKCTEYLSLKEPKFSNSYEAGIQGASANGPWFAEMRRLTASRAPQQLDVAQLVKHAFGLARGRETQPVTLIYLYLEPVDAHESPFFARHRAEVAAFANQVARGHPAFEAITYKELWDAWAASADDWLAAHVQRLRERYEVKAFSGCG